MSKTRVRFAPSPTGGLHLGGARTALFNYLFAKQQAGTFILRLEDTDRERSQEEYAAAIVADMRWLGLDWDEGPEQGGDYGPYRQSERLDRYKAAAEKLVASGVAYKCICEAKEKGAPAEVCSCRDNREKIQEDAKVAVRFYTGEEPVTIEDQIKGRVTVPAENISDFIIVKSDGWPTYQLAVVVDDMEMEISHVIRGEDHLSNTPKQLLLYKALGATPPIFAHLPLLTGADGGPLSKREGDLSLGGFRHKGYTRESLVNFLALLGWAYDDKQQLFDIKELCDKFSLKKVSGHPAVLDREKLDYFNHHYITKGEEAAYLSQAAVFLGSRARDAGRDEAWEKGLLMAVRRNLNSLAEIPEKSGYFFAAPDYDAELMAEHKDAAQLLAELVEKLSGMEKFAGEPLEGVLREFVEQQEIKFKVLALPLRAALTGQKVSAGIFEVMELLGREECVKRVRSFIKAAQGE